MPKWPIPQLYFSVESTPIFTVPLFATRRPAAPGVTERKVCKTLVALKGRLKPSRWGRRPFCAHPGSMPVSLVEQAKRALVSRCGEAARGFSVVHGRVRRGLEVSRGGARQELRRRRRQGSSCFESELILRAHMGSSLGERACAGAREKSALPLL